MSPHLNLDRGFHGLSVLLVVVLAFVAYRYARGLLSVRSSSEMHISAWRMGSFFLGLSMVWAAAGSPFAEYDHSLLTVHMIKHLLLMSIAPALILLGEPLRVFSIGTPPLRRDVIRRGLQHAAVRRFARLVTNPAACWILSAITLLAWHLPALFAVSMESTGWHVVEQISFLLAGLLFWWPVIQPWPSATTGPRWWMLLYLFLATLPCDILSGFLTFSDRVAYPMYFSAPRPFGFSALEDQQCAAALMWTCVTFIYLVPGVILCSKLLAPRTSRDDRLHQSQLA
jgi:putative membrane protein